MNTNIPSKNEVQSWYNEALKFPSFIDTINKYQKEKLIDFCYDKIFNTVKVAIQILDTWTKEKYPEDLSENEYLNYILNTTFKGPNEAPIYILNLLGYTWTPEEGLKQLNQQPKKEIETIESSNEEIQMLHRNKDWKRFSHVQIALILIYKEVKGINDPRSEKDSKLYKIAKDFGYHSKTSPSQIYDLWKNMQGNQNQRLRHKKPKNVIIDIEEIIFMVGGSKNINKLIDDLNYLQKIIENQ